MPFFDGSCGRIFHDSWLPDGDVRAVVVLLHGYAEHLGLYDALGRRLAAEGHAVHAMDCVGHGRSDGVRAQVQSWDHYVADARSVLERPGASAQPFSAACSRRGPGSAWERTPTGPG